MIDLDCHPCRDEWAARQRTAPPAVRLTLAAAAQARADREAARAAAAAEAARLAESATRLHRAGFEAALTVTLADVGGD